MTIKSQIDYRCPTCTLEWLPYAKGLQCPKCARPVPDGEVTGIIAEALESAKFNKKLYGKFDVDYWLPRRLGDKYLKWGFTALQAAEGNPETPALNLAIGALMQSDLEEMAPYREHVAAFLAATIEAYREASRANPADWQKMPEPDKPFFGRKTIE